MRDKALRPFVWTELCVYEQGEATPSVTAELASTGGAIAALWSRLWVSKAQIAS
jgi:hypothetical protein